MTSPPVLRRSAFAGLLLLASLATPSMGSGERRLQAREADPAEAPESGIFVSPRGRDDNPGTAAAPLLHISAAVARAARSGGAVFVAAGEYRESVTTGVSIFGGFDPFTWARDWEKYPTIVHGTHAATLEVRNEAVVIEGFQLEGSAIAVRCSSCSMQLLNNVIRSGSGPQDSTGVQLEGSSDAVVANNVIQSGAGRHSIAVRITSDSTGMLVNNLISGGQGRSSSVGVQVEAGGSADLSGNYVDGGEGEARSSGLFVDSGAVRLLNNTIEGGDGGRSVGIRVLAMSAKTTAPQVLVNNIVTGGSGPGGRPLQLEPGVRAILKHNVLWGPKPASIGGGDVSVGRINACTWRGCAGAVGNLDVSPRLAGAYDFHLRPDSPCVDAGLDPGSWQVEHVTGWDLDGEARPFGGRWDIGADEVRRSYVTSAPRRGQGWTAKIRHSPPRGAALHGNRGGTIGGSPKPVATRSAGAVSTKDVIAAAFADIVNQGRRAAVAHEPRLRSLCTETGGDACPVLAYALQKQERWDEARDELKLCDSAMYCEFALGRDLAFRHADYEGAFTRYVAACQAGLMAACNNVGYSYSRGFGVGRSLERALEYYQAACSRGHLSACGNAATYFIEGKAGPIDRRRGLQLHRQACEGGNFMGCFRFAEETRGARAGSGATTLQSRIRACESTSPREYFKVGMAYSAGSEAPRDERLACEYLERACGAGDMEGCFELGLRYRSGEGVARDEQRASMLIDHACEYGHRPACGSRQPSR